MKTVVESEMSKRTKVGLVASKGVFCTYLICVW